MKRCPECRRDYTDDTLSFCLDDGASLLEGPGTDETKTRMLSVTDLNDEPQTAILNNLSSEAPTKYQIRETEKTAILPKVEIEHLPKTQTVSTKNTIIAGIIGIVLVTVLGIGSYWFYGTRTNKQIESIAVMPFVNESGNADVEYLSDGMTETLIGSLSQIPKLNVKARSSVFRYKGKDTDAKTIGKELNVQAVLTGRVVQRGEQLILYVELVDAATENSLWKQTYNRTMTNLVALQTDIARDVADKLKVKLSGADEQKLAKNYTENAEAYQLYLKGRYHWNRRTRKDINKAIEYFNQAIAIEPNYALAYAGLAETIPFPSFGVIYERSPKVREAALKALSLDDNLPEAHAAFGRVLTIYDWDFAGAEREYRRAIELNPNFADAHYLLGQLLATQGRLEESSAAYRRALELEPLSLIFNSNYGSMLIYARRYDEGIAQLNKTLDLDENFFVTHFHLALAYQAKGDYAAGVEARAKAAEINDNYQFAALTRDSFAKGGWEGYLRTMVEDRRAANLSFYFIATCYAALGEKEKAFEALDKSYENREIPLILLKVDPRLDPLRGDPRFQESLRKVGLPQ